MNNETINFIEEKEDVTLTGYTLSIIGTMNTGYFGGEIIPAIQGIPSIVISQEQNQVLFPETREEHFIDQKLEEFYKKRGYK